jgi:hypothetical protein
MIRAERTRKNKQVRRSEFPLGGGHDVCEREHVVAKRQRHWGRGGRVAMAVSVTKRVTSAFREPQPQ